MTAHYATLKATAIAALDRRDIRAAAATAYNAALAAYTAAADHAAIIATECGVTSYAALEAWDKAEAAYADAIEALALLEA